MRKSSRILQPLFSGVTQRLLAATLLGPGREWYLSDLAAHLRLGPSSLQRTLAGLAAAGILLRRRDGNRVYYKPDPDCPILLELVGIMVKTLGLADPLREALTPLAKRIRFAFIHGSIAEGRERSESDVDVIVVGEVSGLDLTQAVHPVEDRIARAVNVSRYTPKEFKAKVAGGNHFLLAVLDKRRIFLIGGEDDLEEVGGGKPRGRRTLQQEGARRVASDGRDKSSRRRRRTTVAAGKV